jgi:hypothetical protein
MDFIHIDLSEGREPPRSRDGHIMGPGDDREMIESPDKWGSPLLALKRFYDWVGNDCRDKFGLPQFGVLIGHEGPTVYLTNLFMPELDSCDKLEYNSVDELLAAGWTVD